MAVVVIGILLLLTLAVGMATQLFGRARRAETNAPVPPLHGPTPEQQEDIDAVNKGIEQARAELVWLREQVARERARLEHIRRQAQGAGSGKAREQARPAAGPGPRPQPQPVAPTADSPWVILGLRPGASTEDIRRRYRLLSRVWHPDRFMEGPPELRAEAEVMMARLNRAHNALSSHAAGFKR
jgi:DnaJ-domain-containing protein 1